MIRLAKSEILGRLIRQDSIGELTVPTWTLIRDAIRTGKTEEALTLLDYCFNETKPVHDNLCSFVDELLTHLATFGDEEVYAFLRRRYEPMVRRWLTETPDVKESLQRSVEYQRGHGGNCSITEEPDRYVVACDPCGSGGQLRRTKEVLPMKRAYFWTWGKRDIPHYCIHCCVIWEILPIELRGYPIRINEIAENPLDPCIHFYYKRPESIPETFYMRIGQSKTEG